MSEHTTPTGEAAAVPRLVPGTSVRPFDSAIAGSRFLLEHPSGKRWHIAAEAQAIIAEIDNVSDVCTIARRVFSKTNGAVPQQQVSNIIWGPLVEMGVVERPTASASVPTDSPQFLAHRTSPFTWRIPLLSPVILNGVTSALQLLFNRYVAACTMLALLAVNVLTFSAHPELLAPWRHNFADASCLYVLLLTGLAMLCHELGHASACKRFGARHGGIGAGLYLCFPVLYADVTDAWKLSRVQRALVDVGGAYFQAVYAAILMLAGVSGPQSCFLWAAVIVELSAFSCMSPFFRQDGYWLISDLAGIPNLSAKVFRVWCAREETDDSFPLQTQIILWTYGVAAAAFAAYVTYGLSVYLREVVRGGYLERIGEMMALLGNLRQGAAVAPLVPAILRVAVPAFIVGAIAVSGVRSLRYVAAVRTASARHLEVRCRAAGGRSDDGARWRTGLNAYSGPNVWKRGAKPGAKSAGGEGGAR